MMDERAAARQQPQFISDIRVNPLSDYDTIAHIASTAFTIHNSRDLSNSDLKFLLIEQL